jgi:hypothetical protein
MIPACNICRERSPRMYSCADDENCGYDECVDCHNSGRAPGAIPPPPSARAPPARHAHALVRIVGAPRNYVGAARCNACRAAPLPATHHCAACAFDLCDACHARAYGGARAPARGARHAHALTRTVGRLRKHGALARCDACAARAEVTFFCAQCDFDLCEPCHKATYTPRAAAPPASAPPASAPPADAAEPLLGDDEPANPGDV